MKNNPWNDVDKGCLRRIDVEYDLYWAKNDDGQNMFIIELESNNAIDISHLKLSGMSLHLKQEDKQYKIILLLNNADDTEIFYKLCMDIIALVEASEDNISANAIIGRLKRWQMFLSRDKERKFPIEKQIGLFGELSYLSHKLFPEVGIINAIQSWVGPDKDKQDFRLCGINIEIKSYLDHKRGIIHISSIEQLNPINGDLFLYVYGTKIDEEKGQTIGNLIAEIRNMMFTSSDAKTLFVFDELVEKYGFYDCVEYDNLLKFSIFEENSYKVVGDFPTIGLEAKSKAIKSVEYSIDMSMCDKYKVNYSDIENLLK